MMSVTGFVDPVKALCAGERLEQIPSPRDVHELAVAALDLHGDAEQPVAVATTQHGSPAGAIRSLHIFVSESFQASS